jgi:ABC-type oligopeptide transport system substrate-binding subunit
VNKKQEITEFILEKTKQVDFLKVLTLTGSALEKEFVENMDFLLIADQEISEEDFLKIIDIKLSSRYKDCYTFNFKDVLVNITVIGLERFDNYYGNIFYGKKIELSYSNWCLGYFLPEAFLGDIKKSKVIFEKINYSSKYKDKLNSYPALL